MIIHTSTGPPDTRKGLLGRGLYRCPGILLLMVLVLLGPQPAGWVKASDPQPPPAKVTAGAWHATDGTEATVLVLLDAQADLSRIDDTPTPMTRSEAVRAWLWETAERTQPPLRRWLDRRGISYRPFYIVNAIVLNADRAALEALARRPEVDRILSNPEVALSLPAPEMQPQAQAASVPWGVQRVGAPQAWALGFRGQGVVVAGQDTGYDWDHPALKAQYRGWDGATASHNYHWHDAIHSGGGICGPDVPYPCDDNGHGTHTMGTMVGDGGPDARIGVAPEASWIGCRNMSVGVGTPATYAECFEFFLAPYPVGEGPDQGDPGRAPDVINNSWTCPPWEGCDADHTAFLRQVVEAVQAAGILVVASAGNAGSGCSSIIDPPAEFEAALTVGATSSDPEDTIASFSSRGPVGALIKPDLAAPGVGVHSSYPNGGYGSSSGTSMASPHVVGATALLISANSDLRGNVSQLEHILTHTSIPRIDTTCGGAPDGVPNNVYGWGRLDVAAAIQLGRLTGTVYDQTGIPVTGATVAARHTTLRMWEISSDKVGLYSLSPISGTYTVTTSIDGGPLEAYPDIHVSTGQTTTLDLTLPVACVEVTGAALRTTPDVPWFSETIWFTGSIATASLPVTYTWTFGDGSPVRTGNPVTHTYSSTTGTPTTTVTMTATNPCSEISVNHVISIQAYRWYLPLLFKASL